MVPGINGNYTYTTGSLNDFFNDPFFIGFNRDMDRLANTHNLATKQSFPPYDIIRFDDDNYMVSLAVAGFSKDDIDITVEDGNLIIKGEMPEDDVEIQYLHKGIAARKFTRTFALGEYMEVKGAEFKDGILDITLERVVPEEKKPKTIEIKVAKK